MAGAGVLSLREAARRAVTSPADRRPAAGAPRPAPARKRGGRQAERWATRAVVVAAAVAGAFVAVAPTGNRVADRLLAAGFVGLVAAAGSSARRWTWFVAAGAALALADGRPAQVCGLVALVLALASTGPIRPHPAVGAAVGGLSALALLRAADLGFSGSSALATAAAVAPVLASGYRHASRRTRSRARTGALVAGGALAVVVVAFGVAAVTARSAVERGIDRLDAGLAAARRGDDDRAAAQLTAAATDLGRAEDRLGAWWAAPARVVPGLGPNARALHTMAGAAADVAGAGGGAARDADLDALTVRGGQLDLARVSAVGPPLDRVRGALAAADHDAAAADAPWLVDPVARRLDRVRAELAGARPDADLAAETVAVLPSMLGADGPSRWLVAFVTPVEGRGRTGFMGNFAELTATDGKVDMTRFGRAGELESGGTRGADRTLDGPADYLERWGRFRPAATWRNITMSPDFPSVGQVMTQLYPQSGGRKVDGVIAVDPVGLAALMRFTGPIEVPGVGHPLDATNAARYLLRDQYLAAGSNQARIDSLEDLSRATFRRLTTGDLPGPRKLADVLGPIVRGGHLHVYAADPAQQRVVARVGLAGALPPVRGDAFGVVTNNAGGNKADLFLHRDLTYRATWDPASGDVFATATVTLANSAPASGLPGNVIGSSLPARTAPPPGTNRTYLSIYSPWILDGAAIDGKAADIERQREAGRYAYSTFLDVPPGGSRTVTLRLRGQVHDPAAYRLDVTTEPLTRPDTLHLAVDVAGGRHVSATRTLDHELTTTVVRSD